VAPVVYVQVLTGLRVGRDGKVSCPFHGEDRTPSLHVYEAPADGWYCYACARGGSIFDLAAEVFGLSTRGRDFTVLRRRLQGLPVVMEQERTLSLIWLAVVAGKGLFPATSPPSCTDPVRLLLGVGGVRYGSRGHIPCDDGVREAPVAARQQPVHTIRAAVDAFLGSMVGSGLLLLVGLVASVLVFPLGFLVVAAVGGEPLPASNGDQRRDRAVSQRPFADTRRAPLSEPVFPGRSM